MLVRVSSLEKELLHAAAVRRSDPIFAPAWHLWAFALRHTAQDPGQTRIHRDEREIPDSEVKQSKTCSGRNTHQKTQTSKPTCERLGFGEFLMFLEQLPMPNSYDCWIILLMSQSLRDLG